MLPQKPAVVVPLADYPLATGMSLDADRVYPCHMAY